MSTNRKNWFEAQHQTGNILVQRYQIVRVLGKGGMGTTYEAQHLETQATVALKAISLRHLTDAKQLELLEREVEVLKTLNHPSIPQYLDYFEVDSETDRVFYIVQQLAPGKTLAQWVEQGWRGTEAEVKNIAAQILDILAYLHKLEPPVIHRDLKPHNLIRGEDGKVFLVDFGSVQNTYYRTFMGGSTTVGTFGYMPLEQAGGKAFPASDLYSLGATLLYLLTHRSPSELSEDGLTLDFRSRIQLSEEFADWLEKILEPEIESRFTSAKEALTALNNPKLLIEGRLAKKRWLAWLGLGLGSVAGVMLFYSYKWAILSGLGYPLPIEVCHEKGMMLEYLKTGGKLAQVKANECLGKNNYASDSTLLHWAAKKGYKDVAELLIAKGADVNAKNKNGSTPLHMAVEKGYKDVAELLIAKGADVNAKDEYGSTPLHMAASSKYKDIVELLIAKGADVNAKDESGSTPLHEAVIRFSLGSPGVKGEMELFSAQWAVVELLIAKGADVNAKNKNGSTPLHSAVWAAGTNIYTYGYINVVELLKKHGARE
jgi:hypothetical protein